MSRSIRQPVSFQELLEEESLLGERMAYHMRWVFMGIAWFIGLALTLWSSIPQATVWAVVLLSLALGYNAWLGLRMRRGALPRWISYVSVSLDLLVVAGYCYLASRSGHSLAAASSPVLFMYPLVLFFAALRHRRLFLLYSLGCALLLMNLAYFLSYPYMDQGMLSHGGGNNPLNMLLRSVYLTMFGGSLFLLPRIISRLISRQAALFQAQHQAEERYLQDLEQKVEQRTRELTVANQELQNALAEVKTLSGLLPICANCKKIRDDQGYWQGVEQYLSTRSQAEFTHAICPECLSKLYPEIFQAPAQATEPASD